MSLYRVTIQSDFYPLHFDVQTQKWETAVFRAIKMWRAGKGKGNRSTELRVRAVKLTQGTNE